MLVQQYLCPKCDAQVNMNSKGMHQMVCKSPEVAEPAPWDDSEDSLLPWE